MPRKSRRDYRNESRKSAFEVELENPPEGHPGYVTFTDPNKLPGRVSARLGRTNDVEVQLGILLGDDFTAFWDEWGDYPSDELNALVEDVMEHYGTNPKA